jgi:hypothetical protein
MRARIVRAESADQHWLSILTCELDTSANHRMTGECMILTRGYPLSVTDNGTDPPYSLPWHSKWIIDARPTLLIVTPEQVTPVTTYLHLHATILNAHKYTPERWLVNFNLEYMVKVEGKVSVDDVIKWETLYLNDPTARSPYFDWAQENEFNRFGVYRDRK